VEILPVYTHYTFGDYRDEKGKDSQSSYERKLAEWIYHILKELKKMVNYRGKPALVIGQPQPECDIVRLLVT